MNDKPSNTVFLSHATEDLPFVTRLQRKLEDSGWHVLVDSNTIRVGESLPDVIRKMIDDAQLPAELRRQLPEIEANLRQQLDDILADPNMDPRLLALAPAVLALLDGSRRPELWQDPSLFYADAVELKLLLEQLAGG